MLNKINDLVDLKNEEEYLEEYVYKYKSIRMMTGLLILSSFLLLFISFKVINLANSPKNINLFLHNDELNKTVQISYEDYPSFSNEKLESYVEYIIINFFNSDFLSIREKFATYKKYFTSSMWAFFISEIENNYLNKMEEQSLVSQVSILEKPILIAQGEDFYGKKMWKFQTKIIMTYKGSIKNNIVDNMLVEMTIKESSLVDNPNGLIIDEFKLVNLR